MWVVWAGWWSGLAGLLAGGLGWLGWLAGWLAWWHGGWLAFERWRGKSSLLKGLPRPCGMAATFVIVLLGWVVLGQALSPLQGIGAAIVLGSVWAEQRANRPSASTATMLPAPRPARAA